MRPNHRRRSQLAALAGLLIVCSAPIPRALAQQPAPSPGGGGAVITVAVHDSLAGRPLAGAIVQLVSRPDPLALSRSAETDSLGRAIFRDVPAGTYGLGFIHEVLDEIGIEAPLREIQVGSGERRAVALGVPSPAGIREAVCGGRPPGDSTATVTGIVRDPVDHTPMAGVKVSAEWMEIAFSASGISQQVPRITATTGANGWFALCGLPPGTVMVTARSGADSTDRLEFELRPSEVRRRGLFLGVAARGTGRVQGRVVSADGGRALQGVRVTSARGQGTVSDARGDWMLAGIPLGTRMVEFRAVGYYPQRRAVDVVADMTSVEVALSTFQAVLAAVRVEASRTERGDAGAFVKRQRRGGMGRFFPAERIREMAPVRTSDLLRTLPGFRGDGSLQMKGNFSDGAGNFDADCTAEVYIDGHLMRGIEAGELDVLVEPENIYGIEVYSTGSPRPQQFEQGLGGCGALVIWQTPLSGRVKRRR